MKKPTSWIKCPVRCSDPSHTLTIGLDSTGRLLICSTPCGQAEFELAQALGAECCYSFQREFKAFCAETDYDKRSDCKVRLQATVADAPGHVRDLVTWICNDARHLASDRRSEQGQAQQYVRPADYGLVDKISAYNSLLRRLPQDEIARIRVEHNYYGQPDSWASLTVDGTTVAQIVKRAGRSVAIPSAARNYSAPANVVDRKAGQRKVKVCALCNKSAKQGHNASETHTTAMRALVRSVAEGLRLTWYGP